MRRGPYEDDPTQAQTDIWMDPGVRVRGEGAANAERGIPPEAWGLDFSGGGGGGSAPAKFQPTEASVLGQLSPEERARLMQFRTLQQQYPNLQEQVAKAHALRNSPLQRHSTWLGQSLAGLGNMFERYQGGKQEYDKRAEIEANLAKQEELRRLRDEAERRYTQNVDAVPYYLRNPEMG